MDCQPTPTSTLFGSVVITSQSVSTSVSTEAQTITSNGLSLISTCIPTVIANTSTCFPTALTNTFVTIITTSVLRTTVQTFPPFARTFTTPTLTLFDSCRETPSESSTVTVTPPTTIPTSTPTIVAPLTFTTTFTSTAPNGSVFLSTSVTVSTPSPVSNQYESSSTNTPVIIGGVGGGAAGLIVIIAIVWFLMYKKRSGSWHDRHQAGAAEPKRARPAVGDSSSAQADHGRTKNHWPPNSLHPPQLPGTGAGLDSVQPGYFPPHNYPPSSATGYSTRGHLSGFIPRTRTAANSYLPGAAPPLIGAARYGTHDENHRPPRERPLQGTNRPPSNNTGQHHNG